MKRRSALEVGLGLGFAVTAPSLVRAQSSVRVRDLLGREVLLPRPARRIALAQGRHILALNLLHPDPASLLVGWRDDFRRDMATEYAFFRRQMPSLDALPSLGRTAEDLSTEAILATRPDLVLLSRWLVGPDGRASNPLIDVLDRVGIPVAVVDFFSQPMRDTDPSLAILGTLLGRDEQAAALIAFRRETLAAVAARLQEITTRPVAMLHVHAGATPCCNSPGRGTFDELVRTAGGINLGAQILPGPMGQISPETLLVRNPDVYVATGGSFGGRGLHMGAGTAEAEARKSLVGIVAERPISALSAVRAGRAHGLWHGFNDTPAQFLAVEALATWLHPDRMRGQDPRETLTTLNARFAAVPMEGTYWVNLG